MGSVTSAYHFYGVHVPEDEWSEPWAGAEGGRLDTVIRAVKDLAPDVRHITAGDYDRNMLFLCISQPGISSEVPVGQFRLVADESVANPNWDAQLLVVAQTMGYQQTSRPGWIFVPDVS